MLALALLLAACTNVRPVYKIGLIAPFEGLYRRSGYEALAAMRQAIAESPQGDVDFIPLALDDSSYPAHTGRAAQKLLADSQVKAIVGPLSPMLAGAVHDEIDAAQVVWLVPYAVNPAGGFDDPAAAKQWASGLVAGVGAAARRQGAASLVLAGDRSGWPDWDDAAWSAAAGMPVRSLSNTADISTLAADDAIFWTGAADEAAAFLNMHPTLLDALPFWLGPAGGDPILTERAKTDRKLYWITWSNAHYNEWAAGHSPSTPFAFLVHQATRTAIDRVAGAEPAVFPWHVELFELKDGVSRSYTP